ncbi:MAG: hypothetical protein ACJZ1O_04685 [Candidatus Neomarinimicrobiota bacterium]|tara:strand:- start:216 stop:554 length:339 start_codon:yes stop_codon:yes gene_type:complete
MYLIGIILIGTSVILSQEDIVDSVEVHSCDSPLLAIKNSDENRPLKIKEIFPYMIASIKCRFSDRGKAHAKSKEKRNKKLAYDQGYQFKSFSSSCAYCAAYMVVIFYFSSIF